MSKARWGSAIARKESANGGKEENRRRKARATAQPDSELAAYVLTWGVVHRCISISGNALDLHPRAGARAYACPVSKVYM